MAILVEQEKLVIAEPLARLVVKRAEGMDFRPARAGVGASQLELENEDEPIRTDRKRRSGE
jgi:hypothetical protein